MKAATRPPRDAVERALADAIRAELAAIEPGRRCDRVALAAGLGVAAQGRARSAAVARLAVRLEDVARHPFAWDGAADHCRVAWLRGVFLARGSLSLGEGRAHLELVGSPAEALILVQRAADLGMPAPMRLRRGRGVVTWKSLDGVAMVLRRLGASATVLELESRLVTRQLHGHLNRVLNAESANLERMVAASHRQLEAIHALVSRGALPSLTEVDRRVASARMDAPEATLGELAVAVGVSRSRAQRAFQRIEELARMEAGRPG